MIILNINSAIRNTLKTEFEKTTVEEYYNRNKNTPIFTYIAGVLYLNTYIVNYYISNCTCDEESSKIIDILEKYNSIEEFASELTEERFLMLCADVVYFEGLDLYSKKEFMYESTKKKEFLTRLFPAYLIDVLYYLCPNAYDALDRYYSNYRFLKNKKYAINDTIIDCTQDLIDLEEEDPDSFRYVMLDMIKVYYKYILYFCKRFRISDDLFYLDKIEDDLNNFLIEAVGNYEIIGKLVKYYLHYNLLSNNDKKLVDGYYKEPSNRKKLQKVIKKCDELYTKN